MLFRKTDETDIGDNQGEPKHDKSRRIANHNHISKGADEGNKIWMRNLFYFLHYTIITIVK